MRPHALAVGGDGLKARQMLTPLRRILLAHHAAVAVGLRQDLLGSNRTAATESAKSSLPNSPCP